MSGERQADLFRHERENVRVVGQQDNRRAVAINRRQCGREIVASSPEIADACHPDWPRRSLQFGRSVFHNPDIDRFERSADAAVIEPAIMIAQNGNGAGASTEACELCCNCFRSHKPSADNTLNHEIAQHADQVGPRGVCAVHYFVEFRDSVERRSNMKVRKDCDPQRTARESRNVQRLFGDCEAGWLEHKSPNNRREFRTRDESEAPSQDLSAQRHS